VRLESSAESFSQNLCPCFHHQPILLHEGTGISTVVESTAEKEIWLVPVFSSELPVMASVILIAAMARMQPSASVCTRCDNHSLVGSAMCCKRESSRKLLK